MLVTLPEVFEIFSSANKPPQKLKNPWVGSVEILDRLTWREVEAVEAAMTIPDEYKDREDHWRSVRDKYQIPAIVLCVTKWDVQTVNKKLPAFPEKPTLDNFPMSPRTASSELIRLLFREIRTVYFGELEIPNE